MFDLLPVAAHLLEVGVLVLISCIAVGVGQILLRLFGTGRLLSVGERFVFGLALGYGLLSFAMLTMGLLGLLYQPAAMLLLTMLALAAYRAFFVIASDAASAIRRAWGGLRYPPNLFLACIIVLAVGALLARVLAPVTSHDDLMYHLELPRRYIEDHVIRFYPDSAYSLFPLAMEMLYTWGLLLGSDRLPALFALTLGLTGAAAAALFAKRYLVVNRERLWHIVPLLSAALFLTMPITAHIMRGANTDAVQATFDFLALYAFCLGWSRNNKRLLVLAGIFSGLAFSTKYYGFAIGTLIGVALAGRAIVNLFRRKPRTLRRDASAVLAFSTPAVVLASTWLLRNFTEAGNPVWPFASKLFGGAYTSTTFAPEAIGWAPAGAVGVAGVLDSLQFTWNSMARPPTNTDQMVLVVSLGPLLLPALLALPAVRWNSALKWLACSAGWYWLLWAVFFLHASIRYVETCFLFLGPVSAFALVSLAERARPLRWIVGGVVALLLTVVTLDLVLSAKYYVPTVLALDVQAEQRYLSEHIEEYKVLDYVANNTTPDEGLYVWDSQPRGYYIQRRYIYARSVPLYTGFGLPSQLWRDRLTELGIKLVLKHERPYLAPGLAPGYDPFKEAEQQFESRYFGRQLIRVPDYQGSEYVLYELKP